MEKDENMEYSRAGCTIVLKLERPAPARLIRLLKIGRPRQSWILLNNKYLGRRVRSQDGATKFAASITINCLVCNKPQAIAINPSQQKGISNQQTLMQQKSYTSTTNQHSHCNKLLLLQDFRNTHCNEQKVYCNNQENELQQYEKMYATSVPRGEGANDCE